MQHSQPTSDTLLQETAALQDSLNSTVFFTGMPDFTLPAGAWIAIRVLILIVGTWVLIQFLDRIAQRSVRRFEELPQGTPRKQRALNVAALLSSMARYILWPLVAFLILAEFGFNVSALIATAGFAGLALGFGAQTLIKDVIAGFFLLFDDTIHVGDVINVSGQVGVIEDIGIRLLRMRRLDGELVMIPAGELRIFGNKSIGFARVVAEIDLSYEQDVDMLTDELTKVAMEWADDHRQILLEDAPEVHSILRLTDSTVKLRVLAKVSPGEQWEAERNLLRLVKRRFDEKGIEFPFPRRTVYVRNETTPPADSPVRPAGPSGL